MLRAVFCLNSLFIQGNQGIPRIEEETIPVTIRGTDHARCMVEDLED